MDAATRGFLHKDKARFLLIVKAEKLLGLGMRHKGEEINQINCIHEKTKTFGRELGINPMSLVLKALKNNAPNCTPFLTIGIFKDST